MKISESPELTGPLEGKLLVQSGTFGRWRLRCAGQTAGTRHRPRPGSAGARGKGQSPFTTARDHASPPPGALWNVGVSPEPANSLRRSHNVKFRALQPTDQSQNGFRRMTRDKNQLDTSMGGPQRMQATERAQTVARDAPDSSYSSSKEPKETGFSASMPSGCSLLLRRTPGKRASRSPPFDGHILKARTVNGNGRHGSSPWTGGREPAPRSRTAAPPAFAELPRKGALGTRTTGSP